jgi:hypothetical protein
MVYRYRLFKISKKFFYSYSLKVLFSTCYIISLYILSIITVTKSGSSVTVYTSVYNELLIRTNQRAYRLRSYAVLIFRIRTLSGGKVILRYSVRLFLYYLYIIPFIRSIWLNLMSPLSFLKFSSLFIL